MKFNRKSVTLGLMGIGIVGALVAGGVAAAQAATGDGTTRQPMSTASSNGGAHQFGHIVDMTFGQNSPMTAALSYLGLSQAELQDELQSGKSLADVSRTNSKSVSGLEDAMIAAISGDLDSTSTLTADQKAAVVEQMRSRIDAMVNAIHFPGQGMGSGSGIGMGMHMGTGAWSESDPTMGSGMAATQ